MSKKTIKLELITKVKYKGEEYDLQDLFDYLVKKIDEKENIIKEVREYIKSNEFIGRIRLSSENKEAINKLLEILDRVGNNE